MKATEVAKKAAQDWKQLTLSQRAPYEEPYAQDMKVYSEKFKDYVESGKQDAWKRDPEKPKRPLPGFLRFAQEFRQKRPDLKITSQVKEAAAEWKAMPEEMRKPYEVKYSEEKQIWDRSMQEYKASGKEQAWKERVGLAGVEAKSAAKKEAAAEKKAAAAKKKKEAAQKKAEAAKRKKAAAKKAEAAANKKAAAAKKKELALARKKKQAAAAEKKKEAALKKKAAATALAKKKQAAAAAKKKQAAKPRVVVKARRATMTT
jgi:NADH dehydrogenase/NADH:ubiquinone oxidoreductase subunit G